MNVVAQGADAAPAKAADQKFCFACGNVMHISAGTCPKCGAHDNRQTALIPSISHEPNIPVGPTTLPAHHVFCRGCAASIHESAVACPRCGAPQQLAEQGQTTSGRSRVVAAVLALVLGGLGAHKFYLGSIFLGIIYLVLCWTFIPAIVAFIEGIYYLTLSDSDFEKKYG